MRMALELGAREGRGPVEATQVEVGGPMWSE